MKILKNYIYNMSYQVLLLVVPLVTMPYISRVLGPEGLGEFSYTNSIMSYFVLFGSLGISLYGSRQIAYVQNDIQQRSQIFWEITILKILTTVISGLGLIIFLMVYKDYHLLIIAQSLILISVAFDSSWYFMGVEDFKKTVLRNIIVKIISLILIFTLVKSKSDLLTYILIIGGSTLFGNIALIPFLINEIQFFNVKKLKIVQHIVPVTFLFLPQLATQIYLVVNKTMLGQMVSIKAVGFFSSSDTLVRLALTIVSALSAVLMPRIANLIAHGKGQSVEIYMSKSFEFINFLSLPMMAGITVLAPKFVPLFLGSNFTVVSTLIIIEAPVIILISWSIAVTNQFLIPSKMNKEYIISTLVGAISNVILNIILINLYGVYGAIFATLISELLVIVYLAFSIKHKLAIRQMFFSNFHKYAIATFTMFMFTKIFDELLNNSIASILIEVVISIPIYLLVLVLLQAKIVTNIKRFFDE